MSEYDFVGALVERFKELEDRINALETFEYTSIFPFHASSKFLNGEAILNGATFTSSNIRSINNISAVADGIFAVFWIDPIASDVTIYFSAADDTPDTSSQPYVWRGAADANHQLMSQFIMVPLDEDGKINIYVSGSNITAYMTIVGYWE